MLSTQSIPYTSIGLSSFLRFNLIASSYPNESYFETNHSIAKDKLRALSTNHLWDESYVVDVTKNFVDRTTVQYYRGTPLLNLKKYLRPHGNVFCNNNNGIASHAVSTSRQRQPFQISFLCLDGHFKEKIYSWLTRYSKDYLPYRYCCHKACQCKCHK